MLEILSFFSWTFTHRLLRSEQISFGNDTTCGFSQILKELLIEDESHPTDLLYLGLGSRVSVNEVGCNGDGQLTPELFPSKP